MTPTSASDSFLRRGARRPFFDANAVQGSLADNTVLIDMFVGRAPAGAVAVYAVAITREHIDVTVVSHGISDSEVMVEDILVDGDRLRLSPLALQIAELRREIQEPSLGRRRVTRLAEGRLNGSTTY